MNDTQLRIHITNDMMYFENGYTLSFEDGGVCWIVDPGPPPQAEQIVAYVREHDLKPEAVVLTHAHADHIAGIDDVMAGLGDMPLYLSEEEWPMLTDGRENLSVNFGVPIIVKAKDVRPLPVGSTLTLADSTWVVGDVAGHSPGGRSFYCEALGMAIVGDALFQGSIGRTDFHHSNHDQLICNIKETLLTLPDETRILSGHGPETTVGVERVSNPFLLGQ